ncbi:unnamed protein product [Trichobilharzia regenti]|nr:unnamed protein product [Trichobilharzia regenti]
MNPSKEAAKAERERERAKRQKQRQKEKRAAERALAEQREKEAAEQARFLALSDREKVKKKGKSFSSDFFKNEARKKYDTIL